MAGKQHWDPKRYARNARFVSELGRPLFDLLAPKPGERVLDLGCGDGALTEELAKLVGEVIGIDASQEQIAAAQSRGLDARALPAEQLPFTNEFDAVFSNAALHWIKKADETIRGVYCALKNGGRFVGEFGGGNNVSTVRHALHDELESRGIDPMLYDPWYFPTPGEYATKLESAGFSVRSVELFPRPVLLPADITDWLATFAESFLGAVPEADHPSLFDNVRERVKPQLLNADGKWTVDYVRLRFVAYKTQS